MTQPTNLEKAVQAYQTLKARNPGRSYTLLAHEGYLFSVTRKVSGLKWLFLKVFSFGCWSPDYATPRNREMVQTAIDAYNPQEENRFQEVIKAVNELGYRIPERQPSRESSPLSTPSSAPSLQGRSSPGISSQGRSSPQTSSLESSSAMGTSSPELPVRASWKERYQTRLATLEEWAHTFDSKFFEHVERAELSEYQHIKDVRAALLQASNETDAAKLYRELDLDVHQLVIERFVTPLIEDLHYHVRQSVSPDLWPMLQEVRHNWMDPKFMTSFVFTDTCSLKNALGDLYKLQDRTAILEAYNQISEHMASMLANPGRCIKQLWESLVTQVNFHAGGSRFIADLLRQENNWLGTQEPLSQALEKLYKEPDREKAFRQFQGIKKKIFSFCRHYKVERPHYGSKRPSRPKFDYPYKNLAKIFS